MSIEKSHFFLLFSKTEPNSSFLKSVQNKNYKTSSFKLAVKNIIDQCKNNIWAVFNSFWALIIFGQQKLYLARNNLIFGQ